MARAVPRDDDDQTPPPTGKAARHKARIGAVQALYQLDMVGGEARGVIAEFVAHRLDAGADKALFAAIVGGAFDRAADVDSMISGTLVDGWSLDRLETVLRAILRAGVWELLATGDVPPRVVIAEYVDIAHAFFGGREPAMANGVLDRLARVLRPDDFPPRTR